jgi:hypothetical protein
MWSLFLVVAVTGSAVGCKPFAWPPGQKPQPLPPAVDCGEFPAAAFNGANRLGAMLSVHAHAYYDHGIPGPVTPAALGVVSLTQAARFLRCDLDHSPLAPARRRRAIAKLAAYGWVEERFEPELTIMGLEVAVLRAQIQPLLADWPGNQLLLHPEILEWVLTNWIRLHPSVMAILAHDPCDAVPEHPFNPPQLIENGQIVTMDTYVSVRLTRDQVAPNLDPQRWDECSEFWPTPPPEATYLTSVTGWSNCRITNHTAQAPLQAGQPYPSNPRLLFERFVCNTNGCNSWFENVLSVQTWIGQATPVLMQPPVEVYHMDFGLPKCRLGTPYNGFLGGAIENDPATISADSGWIEAWNKGGRAHIRANKSIAFGSPFFTGTTAEALAIKVHELNEQLGELACCMD